MAITSAHLVACSDSGSGSNRFVFILTAHQLDVILRAHRPVSVLQREAVCCKRATDLLQEQAVKLPLTQLIAEVPEVLEHVTPNTFKALLATSKVLRNHALDVVTGISIKSSPKDMNQLVARQWRQLQELSFQTCTNRTTGTATLIPILLFQSWVSLCSLEFKDLSLDVQSLQS